MGMYYRVLAASHGHPQPWSASSSGIGHITIDSCLIGRTMSICLKLSPPDHLRWLCLVLYCVSPYDQPYGSTQVRLLAFSINGRAYILRMVCVFTEGTSSNPISQPFRQTDLIFAFTSTIQQSSRHNFIEDTHTEETRLDIMGGAESERSSFHELSIKNLSLLYFLNQVVSCKNLYTQDEVIIEICELRPIGTRSIEVQSPTTSGVWTANITGCYVHFSCRVGDANRSHSEPIVTAI